ncbi:hypothetical protein FNV43_RR22554 [Rhamnella rubrinervis]|uniref:phosphoglycerate dehydrogenase n=1 Tax=Rhamnella rubrinervis TaxID=2594499 RepID=A0A8K0DXC1_9ROSA|nr:hypothetical protein FNV43_RR22554 [Rhamnella rubrinervis]
MAEKLVRLAVQLVGGGSGVKTIKVTYASARAPDDLDTRLLCAMITKGLIEPISRVLVNLVNADFTTKQRGHRIMPYQRYRRDKGGGIPHLTKVGSFDVDVSLEGSIILCRQVDQPGMIGKVGSILGEENVNVSFMSIGRIAPRKQAVMAFGVDDQPSKSYLKRIGEIPAIEEFVFLKL